MYCTHTVQNSRAVCDPVLFAGEQDCLTTENKRTAFLPNVENHSHDTVKHTKQRKSSATPL
jgi:hypothetical protein